MMLCPSSDINDALGGMRRDEPLNEAIIPFRAALILEAIC